MKQLSVLVSGSLLGLALAFSAVASTTAALRAGAARVDITPPVDPTNPPSGKYEHERLYVRAIVLVEAKTPASGRLDFNFDPAG